MITGATYDGVHGYFFGSKGKCDGMFPSDIENYISRFTYTMSEPEYWYNEKGTARVAWPSVPQNGDVLLLQVRVYADSPSDHFVLIDDLGTIYDPMFGHAKLSDYDAVLCVRTISIGKKDESKNPEAKG